MIEHILLENKSSILVFEKRERIDILIAAPHHSVGGVKNLPCLSHPEGDENTGFIANLIANELNSSLIIACNQKEDPNKYLSTDYSKLILNCKPNYLIEIHGHGGQRVPNKCIEISSGEVNSKFSMEFAGILQRKLDESVSFNDILVNGDFNTIYFKAKKAATVTCNLWTSFHIELPPPIRLNEENKLPEVVCEFVKCVVDTIKAVCV